MKKERRVALQLIRNLLPFHVLNISVSVKTKSLNKIDLEDFELIGYIHHISV